MERSLVLLVDDNPRNIQLLGNLLNEYYKTAVALSGFEALAFVRKNRPDLILLDIMMPEMDGFEVCKELKKDTELKEIPVIFLTAKTDSETVVKGFKIGAKDYITKPFNHDELLARVKTHLDLKIASDNQNRLLSQKEQLIVKLQKAFKEIKTLKEFIPICSFCKKIRNDEQYWEGIEEYISKRTDSRFSHGICPDCARKHYPEFSKGIEKMNNPKD